MLNVSGVETSRLELSSVCMLLKFGLLDPPDINGNDDISVVGDDLPDSIFVSIRFDGPLVSAGEIVVDVFKKADA